MLSIANLIRKIKSPYYYNIGFIDIIPDEFIKNGGFGKHKVTWLKHEYADRWFADPFILDANDETITVLAEEKEYGKPGRLVRLIVSRKTKELMERSVLLELPTHLSYPNPIDCDGKIYIYPENSQSGKLSIYIYHENDELECVASLIDEPLNDATILRDSINNKYYLIATHSDINVHNDAFIFEADSIFGKWRRISEFPIIKDARYARPGGNFFEVGGIIYRPAQDCEGLYGNSLHIMQVESVNPWKEKEVFQLKPELFQYSKGLHTLNFHDSGVAVIDGNGYACPFLGRIFGPILEFMIHQK